MMKRLALFASLVATNAAFGHTVLYELSLTSEVSGTSSPGVGSGLVTVDLDLLTMRVEAEFSGLVGNTTASHIHCCTAAPMVGNAGVVTTTPTFPDFPLGVTAGTYDKTFDMSLASSYNPSFLAGFGGLTGDALATLLTGFDAGKAYLNIHTSTFQGGEIRGYLIRVPEPGALALGIAAFPFALRRSRRAAA